MTPWIGGLTIRQRGPRGQPTADYLCTHCTPPHHARITGKEQLTKRAIDLHLNHQATHHRKATTP